MATDNKYDRQLRLWGSEGQRLLSSSKVCVLHSSGLSSETLKNLVLPGLGFFTIVDDAVVQDSDFGNNFFITTEDLGKPRADVVKTWLLELNPDVQGESLIKSIDEVLSDSSFLKKFNLIIANQISFFQAKILSQICEEHNIDLIIGKSVGLLGYLRVYAKEHLVVESKITDKEIYDLRLHKPFEELVEYCKEVNISELENILHAHVPFIVILIQVVEEWVSLKGQRPRTFEEKTQFKEFIKSKSLDFYNEINFREAVERAYLCFINEDLPESSLEILEDPKSINADENSEDYWICAKSVKEFINNNGIPPLTGLFPDMTSDTKSYISMQELYKAKAEKDYQQVLENYKKIKKTDKEPEILKVFCKNLYSLEVTRTKSIQDELESINTECIEEAESGELALLDWYAGIRTLDNFQHKHSKDPGINDIQELKDYLEGFYKPVSDDIIEEMIRFGSSELHCISALIGGVGSQEAVKLITKQYTPINNTFIYNGIYSTSEVLNL